MKFDFTTIMDRKGKDAIALDVDAALKGKMLGVENVKIATLYPISFQWSISLRSFRCPRCSPSNFPMLTTVGSSI